MANKVVASVGITVALSTEATEKGLYMSVQAAKQSENADDIGTDSEFTNTSQFNAGDTAYFIVYHHPDVVIDQIVSSYGTLQLHQANRAFTQCDVLSFTTIEDLKESDTKYNEAAVSQSVGGSYSVQWYTSSIPVQLALDKKTFRSQTFNLAIGNFKYSTITDIYKLSLPAQIPASTLNCPNSDTDTFPIQIIFIGSDGTV